MLVGEKSQSGTLDILKFRTGQKKGEIRGEKARASKRYEENMLLIFRK